MGLPPAALALANRSHRHARTLAIFPRNKRWQRFTCQNAATSQRARLWKEAADCYVSGLLISTKLCLVITDHKRVLCHRVYLCIVFDTEYIYIVISSVLFQDDRFRLLFQLGKVLHYLLITSQKWSQICSRARLRFRNG